MAKIMQHVFVGANPNPKRTVLAEGVPHPDFFFEDGRLELFVPFNGGPNGYVLVLSREERMNLAKMIGAEIV